MKKRKMLITLALGIAMVIILTLSACGQSEPEVDIEAQRTGFAQTAEVQATMTAEAQPTATETPLPTATFTSTPNVTNTPANTPTPENGAGGGTDRAVLIAQSPEDNSAITPGEAFTVTWTFENSGSSTWTNNYYIQFSSGEQMGAPEKVFFWLPVPPGTSLPLTVNFTAPSATGNVTSRWKVVNANDSAFYDFSITLDISASE